MALGDSTLVRAAANSIAKGKPSKRKQMSRIAGEFSAVSKKLGRAAIARVQITARLILCQRRHGNSCSHRYADTRGW